MANLDLTKRAVCYDYYGGYYTCQSGWYTWGRWVVFGLIVLAAFFIFFLFACLSARRRRRRGQQPYRGTGWVGRTPFGHGPAVYNPGPGQQQHQYGNQPPPPQYTPHGGYYGNTQNQGYFGGQQNGVELQPPSNVYRGGDQVYEPPAGPPPGKKDTTVR